VSNNRHEVSFFVFRFFVSQWLLVLALAAQYNQAPRDTIGWDSPSFATRRNMKRLDSFDVWTLNSLFVASVVRDCVIHCSTITSVMKSNCLLCHLRCVSYRLNFPPIGPALVASPEAMVGMYFFRDLAASRKLSFLGDS
jgi:hypothetical protein